MSDPTVILCNGAAMGRRERSRGGQLRLEYRPPDANVAIGLPDFVRSLGTLPPRFLDLLELASYVYCADRRISRGSPTSLEFHSWSRRLEFRVRCRDAEFWARADVVDALTELLHFLTGDEPYRFAFEGGHATPPASLFDTGEVTECASDADVQLFSGGLDSLAGAVEHLSTRDSPLCLVSHSSRQPSVTRTQRELVRALRGRYAGRVAHYQFRCHLTGERAQEETQRSRFFLYACMAFALGRALGRDGFAACENGITSLNFPRREDAGLGRSSRTTHPRTIAGLNQLFTIIAEEPFEIATPFLWKTKTDVVRLLESHGQIDLLPSSVSCTKTFILGEGKTHCGCCFQCVDRRLAILAAELEDNENPQLYAKDLARDVLDAEQKTTFVDYVRQAIRTSEMGVDRFGRERVNDLLAVLPHVGVDSEPEALEQLWRLWQTHGSRVRGALRRLRDLYDDPALPVVADTALDLIRNRAYLRPPVEALIAALADRLSNSIPIAFQHERPSREHSLNDHIEAVLNADGESLRREHPAIRFASVRAVPDHQVAGHDLLIEAKYPRKTRPPSKITDEVAADIVKYRAAGHTLFVIYDPDSTIADRRAFRQGFAAEAGCTVLIVPR